jgi:predicted ATPase
MEVWIGEADALNAGLAFGVLARVLLHALGLLEDEPIEVQREKIRARVARQPAGGDARLAELLGEVVGAPFELEGTAGHEPPWSEQQTRQAFLSFLRAECSVQPVVIVLEDLHWGDLPTIKLIDMVLGALSDRPLMVIALARTDLHEIFPQLWSDRFVQEIRLRKLSRRTGEHLARQALGDAVADETLRAIVERSEGQASYLEELIRAAAEGKSSTPEVVLAMVQTRIEKLDPAARRVLRAASIFGETFWRGGVEAILGSGDTAAWLAELVEQDVIAIRDHGRFPADVEFRFRHVLVQEAAYAMLTEGDRVIGHWLAGQWLEQSGETDVAILGKHFNFGEHFER